HHQPGHRPLDHLSRLEEAAPWIVPTPLQRHPMLQQQSQPFSIQLGQDALRLATPPRINLAPLRGTSFQKSSIGPRKRSSATTCSAARREPGTLVSTSTHSSCFCLLALTWWCLRTRRDERYPACGLGRRPNSCTPLLCGRPTT